MSKSSRYLNLETDECYSTLEKEAQAYKSKLKEYNEKKGYMNNNMLPYFNNHFKKYFISPVSITDKRQLSIKLLDIKSATQTPVESRQLSPNVSYVSLRKIQQFQKNNQAKKNKAKKAKTLDSQMRLIQKETPLFGEYNLKSKKFPDIHQNKRNAFDIDSIFINGNSVKKKNRLPVIVKNT